MGISFSLQEALKVYEVVAATVFFCMQRISNLKWFPVYTTLTTLKAFTEILFSRLWKSLHYKTLKRKHDLEYLG